MGKVQLAPWCLWPSQQQPSIELDYDRFLTNFSQPKALTLPEVINDAWEQREGSRFWPLASMEETRCNVFKACLCVGQENAPKPKSLAFTIMPNGVYTKEKIKAKALTLVPVVTMKSIVGIPENEDIPTGAIETNVRAKSGRKKFKVVIKKPSDQISEADKNDWTDDQWICPIFWVRTTSDPEEANMAWVSKTSQMIPVPCLQNTKVVEPYTELKYFVEKVERERLEGASVVKGKGTGKGKRKPDKRGKGPEAQAEPSAKRRKPAVTVPAKKAAKDDA